MKKFLQLLLLFGCIQSQAQTQTVEYAKLDTAAPVSGKLVKQVDAETTDVIIEISGVNAEADIDNFDVYIGTGIGTDADRAKELKDKKTALSGKHDSTKKTYTMVLTTPIRSLGKDKNAAVTIRKRTDPSKADWKKDKPVFSFDVEVKSEIPLLDPCEKEGFQRMAEDEFEKRILNKYIKNLGIKEKHNLYIDKFNTVHIFVDHYGQFHGHGLPTTATEEYSYQVHLITSACLEDANRYYFDYSGNYNPTLNIDKGASAQAGGKAEITVIDFPVIGPFTEKFTFNVKRAPLGKSDQKATIIDAEVKIPKLYHVSITTGLIATTLRNPQNIEIAPLNDTQNTLIADDPGVRGLITVMAVYYPKGRSFLFPPQGGIFDLSRVGIVVGTQLGKDANENFLLGLSHDFARAGAITYGIHFGRRNTIPGNRHFDFGDSAYDLTDVSVKKEWNVGLFFGVSIDARVAAELLKTLFSAE